MSATVYACTCAHSRRYFETNGKEIRDARAEVFMYVDNYDQGEVGYG